MGGTREVGKEISDNYTNLDTVDILNGDIVSIVGASGNRSAVKLTDTNDDLLAQATIGMCTVDVIPVNENGEITKDGKVHGLNTNTYTEGDVLWVDPNNNGKWTNIKPVTSKYAIKVGIVVVKHHVEGVIDLTITVYDNISVNPKTQYVDTTVTKVTLAAADKVPLYDSVTGKVVLTPKSNFVEAKPDVWYPITLLGAWVNVPNFNAASFMKDTNGVVHLRGRISGGVIGSFAFSLPTDYRITGTSNFFPLVSNNAFGYIHISQTGQCYLGGNNTYVDLVGVSFKV